MFTQTNYIQLKAYARQDGFFLGLLWILTFGFFIASMTNPSWQIGFVAGMASTPFIIYSRLRHFRDYVLEGSISFRRAFAFIALTMFYGSLILAGMTLAYFYFFDDGLFVSTMQKNLSMPEMRQALVQAGFSLKDLDAQMMLITETRPIDIAFSILSNGVVSSVFLAAILGCIGKRTAKVEKE